MKHRFSILFAALAFPVIVISAGKELEGERAAAQAICPSPEEARKKMTVPEGYEVRCFAHEPMVVNPVAMTWDARGRLWVVEGYEYPNGSEFKNNAFGVEAKDDQYHPVSDVCKAKDNPLNAMRADHPKIPKDRIVILEDTDNDGVADKRTVFVEGLDMGSAILLGDGGVYVGQQPHLLHFKDTDGDDHADEWRVVLTGFGREDTHELLNSFCWGPDGWLYMTHGVFTNSRVRRPGEPLEKGFKFDAGIGRCRPKINGDKSAAASWEFEVFADGTSNPWGCDYDARGNFFVSACVIDHFFHMAPGGIYVRQGGAPENPYAYEMLPSIVKHKHFRAAYAGVQIYQGGVYPADTNGHAFIGNIHDNAVHEEIITPVGASFKCEPRRDFIRANDGWFRPVSSQTGPDGNLWVMDWCDKYPCYQNAKANPEGVDRERGRIWRVVYTGRNTAVAAVGVVGVSPATANVSGGTPVLQSRASREMDLSKLPTSELVNVLAHPNNWMRRMARRQLVERKDVERTVRCISSFPDESAPAVKLECLFTMHGIGALDSTLLDKIAANANPAMRAWSARLTGEFWRNPLMDAASLANALSLRDFKVGVDELSKATGRLGNLGKDSELIVRHASAVALRQMVAGNLTVNRPTLLSQNKEIGPSIVQRILGSIAADEYVVGATPGFMCLYYEKDVRHGEVVKRQNGDGLLAFACWQAAEPIVRENWSTMQGDNTWIFNMSLSSWSKGSVLDSFAERTCRRIAESQDANLLGKLARSIPSGGGNDERLAKCLAGLVRGQEAKTVKPDTDVTPILAKWLGTDNELARQNAEKLAVMWGDPTGEEILRRIVLDMTLSAERRIEALQLARKSSPKLLKEALGQILSARSSNPQPLVLEAIRAAAGLLDGDAPLWLLQRWPTFSMPERSVAAEVLVSREGWAASLLDAVKDQRVSPSDVPMTGRRALATHSNAALKKRAEELLGQWRESPADVKALIISKRKVCLEGEPDLAQGKIIFTTTCAVCHSFHGGGQKVGPDLIGSGRSNLDALLANVIDPNQIIGNGYENINVTTKDGRTVAGRMVEDTPSHVKLLAIGGVEQIVTRDQIAKLENTHQSVMPQGFGALPDDAFRNLIWYILSPTEEGPLTKEKKKLLSQGVEGGEGAKKKPSGNNARAIDWESVSLWNPEWKVEAPDFERTPVKLAEFHGRNNVLLMHPFTKDKPSALERTMKLESGKPHKLTVTVAAHDQGDWELRVLVNGKVVTKEIINHDGERWKVITTDLSKEAGNEVKLRIEGAANGWSNEFGYWGAVKVE